MTKYQISFLLYHESFGGRDHCDGWHDFFVNAKNEKLAIDKAKKLVPFGHWIKDTTVFNRAKKNS